MRRIGKIIIWSTASVSLVAVLLFIVLSDSVPSMRIIKISSRINESTQLRLYRLHGKDDEFDGGVFFQGKDRGDFGTYGDVALNRESVADLLSVINSIKQDPKGVALAHTPQYGIKIFKNNEIIDEFTVSWNCSNIAFESRLLGIYYAQVYRDELFEHLLSRFNDLLPYNPNFLEEEEQRMKDVMKEMDGTSESL